MNSDIRKYAGWARQNGWTVVDNASGYTEFYNPEGAKIHTYPATPSNPYRRMLDLAVALRRAGLAWPPPSKKEQRSQRRKAGEEER